MILQTDRRISGCAKRGSREMPGIPEGLVNQVLFRWNGLVAFSLLVNTLVNSTAVILTERQSLNPGSELPNQVLDEAEALSEIDPLDLGIVPQLSGVPGAEDAALIDDVGAVGDRECLAYIVVGDQDADPALL